MSSQTSALVMGVGPEQGLGAALCRRFAKEGLQWNFLFLISEYMMEIL